MTENFHQQQHPQQEEASEMEQRRDVYMISRSHATNDQELFLAELHRFISSEPFNQYIRWRNDGNGFAIAGTKQSKDECNRNLKKKYQWSLGLRSLTNHLSDKLGFHSAGTTGEYKHRKNWG